MAIEDAVLYSQVPIDNVIAVYNGSMGIPIAGDPPVVTTFSTGITNTTFFQGVFSTDVNPAYNDIGGFTFVNDGVGDFTRYGLEAYSQNGTINVRSRSNDLVDTHTATFKIAIITQPNQGVVPAESSTIKENFYSQRNYQKIAVDDIQPVSIPATTVITIPVPHNLGYTPCARPFIDVSGTLYDGLGTPALVEDGFFARCTAEVTGDAANVYITFVNDSTIAFDAILYTRIYYDPS